MISQAQMQFFGQPYLVDGKTMHSGVAMGITDLNNDGLDDLIMLDDTRELYVHFQTVGHGRRAVKKIGRLGSSSNWSLQAADVDGNGQQDIFTAGPGGMKLQLGNGLVPIYTAESIDAINFLSQGSNFADMDGDGDLDLFVCDDDAESFIALNDGDGNFSEAFNMMDFSTTPPSDGSGNYGSMWSDYDRDGDLDMYLAKCRLGTVPGDPERTNQFFLNTDTGFVRNYDHPEILSNDQSWVADFVDVDNDGDWDLFVANHGGAPINLFIRQDDGSFVDEAAARGIDFISNAIQLVSGDFDNDGDVDMFVVGSDHIMFENDGNGYFTDGNFPEETNQIESATCGDMNNDGRLDIYAGYAQIYNTPTNIPDKLFTNWTTGGSFIKFSLRGTGSNTFAIGATVEIFHGNTSQIREVRSGESYGINKSNIVHFGLGDIFEVDSVKVYWPSGTVEKIGRSNSRRTYELTEGESTVFYFDTQEITASKDALCDNDTIELTCELVTSSDVDEYLWSTGETTQSIMVDATGMYTVRYRIGTQWMTAPTFLVANENQDQPFVRTFRNDYLLKCAHDEISLSAGFLTPGVVWNTGHEGSRLSVSEAGEYSFAEHRACNVYYSDTVEVENYFVESPTVEHDTVMRNQSATIIADNNETVWVADTISQEILFVGNEFLIDTLKEDSVLFTAASQEFQRNLIALGVAAPDTNVDGYHNRVLNVGLLFSADVDCTIDHVTVYCRVPGNRTIVIRDSDSNAEVFRKEINMSVGSNVLTLLADVEADHNYYITTDSDENLINLGFESPDFMRSAEPVVYPFDNSVLRITGTTVSTNQYYYFYDWQVRPKNVSCYSHWVPAHAVVAGTVANSDIERLEGSVMVYPNPTRNQINIELSEKEVWETAELINEEGKRIKTMPIAGQRHLIIKNVTPGLYLVKVSTSDGNYGMKKVLVIE